MLYERRAEVRPPYVDRLNGTKDGRWAQGVLCMFLKIFQHPRASRVMLSNQRLRKLQSFELCKEITDELGAGKLLELPE